MFGSTSPGGLRAVHALSPKTAGAQTGVFVSVWLLVVRPLPLRTCSPLCTASACREGKGGASSLDIDRD